MPLRIAERYLKSCMIYFSNVMITGSQRLLCYIDEMFCSRNVHHLLEDVMELLDTPSKTVLWHHIIPLLSIQDQKYCHKVIPFIEPPGAPGA